MNIYDFFLYKPLLNLLVWLYETIAFKDLGIAIILLTVFVRIVLYPIFQKMAQSQAQMQKLQPELQRLQGLHGKNKEKYVQATLELYKKNRINPFSNFFFLLIQIPILFALFQILQNILTPGFTSSLYSFVTPPGEINLSFLGLINLKERSMVMVALTAVAQYIQGRMALPPLPKDRELSDTERISRQMVFIGPVLTIVFFYTFPAAIGLYWLVSTVFSIFQQYMVNKKYYGLGANNQKNN